MAYPGALATPSADTRTEETYDYSNLGSQIESFQSTRGYDLFRPGGRRRGGAAATPQQPVFGRIVNQRDSRGRQEFTPLLKSVHRSNVKQKLTGDASTVPMPEFLQPGAAIGSSPQLPQGSSEIGDSTYRTGDDEETMGPQKLPDSSLDSTPIAPLRRGGNDVLSGEGQLTLREQERIIDEIRKENFGLKLKIVFLNERLDKLGPEYNDAAIKENIEIKVERATLKAELKRYKKSLLDSERAIAELREQMINTQDNTQRKYADSRRSEEEARVREELTERLKASQAKLAEAMAETSRLRDEAEDYRAQLEDMQSQGVGGMGELEKELEVLTDKKEDLEAELREKERLLDEREDQLEDIGGELRDREDRIKELEEHAESLQARIGAFEREQEVKLGANDEALAEKEEALKRADQQIRELNQVLTNFQHRADEERSEAAQSLEGAERQNQRLEGANARLREELDRVREEACNKSLSYKGRLEVDNGRLKALEFDLEEARQSRDEMSIQVHEKEDENMRLRNKVDDLNKEFDMEIATLQDKLSTVAQEREAAVKARKNTESELHQTRTELSKVTSEKDLLLMRHDGLTEESGSLQKELDRLKKSLRDSTASLQKERELALTGEQSLKKQFELERRSLEGEVGSLEKDLEEKQRTYDRACDDWASEKRQLDLRVQRAEETANSLRRTMESLQHTENMLQGEGAKLADALKSEAERYQAAESGLQKQIDELYDEINKGKQAFNDKVRELSAVKDELRQAHKTENSLQEKIRGLDDELELLTIQLEEEQGEVGRRLAESKSEAEGLRAKLKEAKVALTRLESQHATAQADIRTVRGDLQADELLQKQLQQDLRESNKRFETAKKERQQLQEQVTSLQAQLTSLRTEAADMEIERDELRNKLAQFTKHGDLNKSSDSEKIELKKAKNKLDIELRHAIDERVILERKIDELEADLREAVQEAREQEEKAWSFETELKRVKGMGEKMAQKEDTHRKEQRELRQRISDLERKLREADNKPVAIAHVSPDAKLSELEDLRRQLIAAHEEARGYRGQLKSSDRKLQDRNTENSKLTHELSMLEQEVNEVRQSNANLVQKNLDATTTIGELRKKVHALERDLHQAQFDKHLKASDAASTQQIAEERRDLQERLRSATRKLDDLRQLLSRREAEALACRKAEQELENQLRSLKKEKQQVFSKAERTLSELERVNRRYQRAIDSNAQLQKAWDEERRAIKQRVRFSASAESKAATLPSTSTPDAQRHQAELNGLAKQIRYLKARVARESSFRSDLAFSKQFFLMQIDLYSSANEANMQLIQQMGIYPDSYIRQKRPALKSVASAIIATIRLGKLANKWRVNKQWRNEILLSLERARAA